MRKEEKNLRKKAPTLLDQGQAAFKKYLKKKGIDPEKLSDKEAEKLLSEL